MRVIIIPSNRWQQSFVFLHEIEKDKSRTKSRDFQIPFLFQLTSKMVGAITNP